MYRLGGIKWYELGGKRSATLRFTFGCQKPRIFCFSSVSVVVLRMSHSSADFLKLDDAVSCAATSNENVRVSLLSCSKSVKFELSPIPESLAESILMCLSLNDLPVKFYY